MVIHSLFVEIGGQYFRFESQAVETPLVFFYVRLLLLISTGLTDIAVIREDRAMGNELAP